VEVSYGPHARVRVRSPTPQQEDADADLRRLERKGGGRSESATAVDRLADDVRVAGMSSRFLDEVHRHPT
jgi:hypothetical protein